jgi:Uma2 family endonuclease
LTIEILSPGGKDERLNREVKLKLYSRHGVLEYWVVDWQKRRIEVYRRQQAVLELAVTLYEEDKLVSPILPSFSCQVGELFDEIF